MSAARVTSGLHGHAAELAGELGPAVAVQVDQHEAPALGGEAARGGGSDPARHVRG
jgi:hypothetical protein